MPPSLPEYRGARNRSPARSDDRTGQPVLNIRPQSPVRRQFRRFRAARRPLRIATEPSSPSSPGCRLASPRSVAIRARSSTVLAAGGARSHARRSPAPDTAQSPPARQRSDAAPRAASTSATDGMAPSRPPREASGHTCRGDQSDRGRRLELRPESSAGRAREPPGETAAVPGGGRAGGGAGATGARRSGCRARSPHEVVSTLPVAFWWARIPIAFKRLFAQVLWLISRLRATPAPGRGELAMNGSGRGAPRSRQAQLRSVDDLPAGGSRPCAPDLDSCGGFE